MIDSESHHLRRHLVVLEQGDNHFCEFWQRLGEENKRLFRLLCREIENVSQSSEQEVALLHERASDLTRRYLSCIPQKDLDYGRRPRDWIDFVASEEEKNSLWIATEARLKRFLEPYERTGKARLYGGVKPLASLDEKLGETKSGWAARRNLRDTWDAVRCRLVAADLATLRQIGIEIWQYYIDGIIKCSNFYSYSQDGPETGSYRAIHFLIEIEERRWIEAQVLTEARDLVGYLDHAFLFKRRLQFYNREHEDWLRGLTVKANIFDASRIPPGSLRTPSSAGLS